MNQDSFNQGLIDFIAASPTPFHAVETMKKKLLDAGYQSLDESEEWQLNVGNRYFTTRNNSSIIAFNYEDPELVKQGIAMVGAHTDSPCLKLKPNAEVSKQGYLLSGVEVYGGVLLAPWFDRDLSLAGRVSYKVEGEIRHELINFERAIGSVPNLAIHLNRTANDGNAINAQKELPVLLALNNERQTLHDVLLQELKKHDAKAEVILDHELSFYDTQKPAVIGLNDEFIAGARLDNLLSCYVGIEALIASSGKNALLVCNDHEEVGSASAAGAQGPMLQQFLLRLLSSPEDQTRMLVNSVMISADNAHGIHPNYPEKHDAQHGPMLNQGPVIKINANQRYASNSETQSYFRHLCQSLDVPVQSFVVRSDMACGSTIGPITAAELGVKTVDVGVPTFGMHSIRETAGSEDSYSLLKVLKSHFSG